MGLKNVVQDQKDTHAVQDSMECYCLSVYTSWRAKNKLHYKAQSCRRRSTRYHSTHIFNEILYINLAKFNENDCFCAHEVIKRWYNSLFNVSKVLLRLIKWILPHTRSGRDYITWLLVSSIQLTPMKKRLLPGLATNLRNFTRKITLSPLARNHAVYAQTFSFSSA